MGGDYNAWSPLWKCNKSNKRGELLEDFLISEDLYVENTGDINTYKGKGSQEGSIIDLTITNHIGKKLLNNWYVSEEESGSDHKYIKFEINTKTKTERIKFRNMKKMDWELYKSRVEELTRELSNMKVNTNKDLDYQVEKMTECLHKALDEQCPLVEKRKKVGNKWYTEELRQMKEKLGKGLGNESAKQMANRYGKMVKQTKRNHMQDLVEEVSGSKDISKMIREHNKEIAAGRRYMKKPDGTYTESKSESEKILLDLSLIHI